MYSLNILPFLYIPDYRVYFGHYRVSFKWGRLPLNLIENSLQDGSLCRVPDFILSALDVPLYLIRHQIYPLGKITHPIWDSIQNKESAALNEK